MVFGVQRVSEEVERLQNCLISAATGGRWYEEEFADLRRGLLRNEVVSGRLPHFVRTCRDLSQFWEFIKNEYGTYSDRRVFLWDSFRPLFEILENESNGPGNPSISEGLEKLDAVQVNEVWTKALGRLVDDPEGAITSARALLETVCKHILEEASEPYEDNSDLPKLYGATARTLNLAPDQHSEQVFKQILGGCTSVVNGLAGVRNKLGDAHGQGITQVKPSRRHARLAVHLSGAMSAFLIETWENKTQ